MYIVMINKETAQGVKYPDAMGYDTHGAIETENGIEPVFQIVFTDYSTATFKKSEWDLFVIKKV